MAAVNLNNLLGTFSFNGPLEPGRTFSTVNEKADISYIAGVDANYATASRSWAKDWDAGVIKTFGPGTSITVGFYNPLSFTDQAKDYAFQSLQLWSGLVGLKFVYSADPTKAQFNFAHTGDNYNLGFIDGSSQVLGTGTLYGTQIGATTARPDVTFTRTGYIQIDNVSKAKDSNGNLTTDPAYGDIGSYTVMNGYGIDVLVHEVGHLVGLGHSGNYNGTVAAATQQFNEFDVRTWSLESYIDPTATVVDGNSKPETPSYLSSYPVQVDWKGEAPFTPMGLDIIAAQRLVGPSSNSMFSGNNTFGFNSNITYTALDGTQKKLSMYDFTVDTKPVVTLYDYGTNNTLDLSGFSAAANVSLKDGSFSSAAGLKNNVFIEWGTQIDRAIGGTGDDTFILNERGDYVDGGAGTNTAVFSGARSEYVLGYAGNGDVELTKASNGQSYRLHNIQSFQFTTSAGTSTSTLADLPRVSWVGTSAANGDHFGIAANWSNGQVPDITSQVSIGAGASVVVTLQARNEVDSLTLAPTASIDVTGQFVINNGAASSTNSGIITVESGATLYFSGGLGNSGTLRVSGEVLTHSAEMTLDGGGTVLLDGVIGGQNPYNIDTFTNQDNLIEGTGTIGRSGFAFPIAFVNGSAGRVLANGPGSLTISAGTINIGQMIANGGVLRLTSAVDQRGGGRVTASGTTSKILFDGGSLSGGVLSATDGATIEVDANATLSDALTINGDVAVTTGATLKLVGDIYLNGTIDGTGGHLDLSGAHIHGGTVTGGSGGLNLVSSDGFLDGAGATVGNVGAVDIGPGRTLTVKGSLSNSGTIKVDGSSGYGAATLLVSDVVTLTGGGKIVMLDSYGTNLSATVAIIRGTIASEKLDNVNNTIQGYGQLGAGTLTFVNEVGGTVNATASTLTMDTGANASSNFGLLAAQGGTLVIASPLTNAGSIYSGAGGTVMVKAAITNTGGVQIAYGTLALNGGSLSGTGSVEVAGKLETVTTGTIDGTGHPVHLFGDSVVDQGATLTLKGAIQNQGNAKLNGSSGYGAATLLAAGKVTLSGGGTVTLLDTYGTNQSATVAVLRGTGVTDILENADNIIQGYGQLGAGALTLINKSIATIDATSGTLNVDTGPAVITNYGLLEAVGGTLAVNSAVANAGKILAGAGGHVVLHGAVTGAGSVKSDQGGTLVLAGATIARTATVSSAVGTTIEVVSTGGLDGSQIAISQAGTLAIDHGGSLTLAGTIVNSGAIALNASSGYGTASLTVSGPVKLTGGGTLTLLDTYGSNKSTTVSTVAGSTSSDSLENAYNTIQGYGQLGAGKLTLVNDASGTIDATDSTLLLRTSSMRNAGLLEAGGGTLAIETTIDNSGGRIVAAGSAVQLGGEGVAAVITGGVLSRSGTGTFAVTAAATLKDLTSSGPILVNSGATLTLAGAIVDQGGISVNGSSGYGASTLRVNGQVSLSGGGTITLTDTYGSNLSGTVAAISGAAAGDSLDNVDNTIQGYGQIGNNLAFSNEASGVVDAMAGTLTLDTGARHIVNRGLIEATTGNLTISSATDNTGQLLASSGGTLTLHNVIFNNSTISVASGGKMVLGNSAITGTGGAVAAAAGSSIEVSALSMLDGQHSSVTLKGNLAIDHGGSLTLAGTIVNSGAIALNASSGYGTASLTVSGPVKLTGGGTLTLLDTYGSNKSTTVSTVAGSTSSDSLENADNTIQGYGQLGAGKLTLVNDASGTIDATDSTLLLRTSSMRNAGLLEAGGGTLAIETTIDNSGGRIVAAGSAVQLGGEGVAAVITGGVLSRSGTGTFAVTAAATLKDLTSSGPILVNSGATLTLAGAIVDQGGISVNGSSGYGASTLRVNGQVSLSGGGTITLTDTYGSNLSGTVAAISGAAAGDSLDNVDNTIQGYGQIGNNLAFSNEASGVVDATASTLTIGAGSSTVVNRGRMVADGGALTLATAVNNSGVIEAKSGVVTLGGALTGSGTVRIDKGGTLQLNATAAATDTVVFTDTGATLAIGTAQTSSGPVPYAIDATISGFRNGDTMLLAQPVTAATYNAADGSLVLRNGTTIVDTLHLTGNFTGQTFAVSARSGGGVSIGLVGTAGLQPITIGGINATLTVEPGAMATPFAGVTIADANSGTTETVTVTEAAPSSGALASLGGGSFDAGTGVYSITGTLSATQNALQSLTFTPADPGTVATTDLTLHVSDSAGVSSSAITHFTVVPAPKLLDNSDGTSSSYNYNLSPQVKQTITRYSGKGGTGSVLSNIINKTDLSSLLFAYNPTPTVLATISQYTGTDPSNGAPSGAKVSDVVDNKDGSSLIYAYHPTPDVLQTTAKFSATNAADGSPAGTRVSDVVANADGTSLVYAYNPTSTVKQVTSKYSATDPVNGAPTGAQISAVVDNTDGTALLYAFNPTSTVIKTAALYSSTDPSNGAPIGRQLSLVFDYVSGQSSVTTFSLTGGTHTTYYAGPDGTGGAIADPTASGPARAAAAPPSDVAEVSARSIAAFASSEPVATTGSNQVIDLGLSDASFQFMPGSTDNAVKLHPGSVDTLLGFDPWSNVLDFSDFFAAAHVTLGTTGPSLANYVTVVKQGADAMVRFDATGHAGGSSAALLAGLGDHVTSAGSLLIRTA